MTNEPEGEGWQAKLVTRILAAHKWMPTRFYRIRKEVQTGQVLPLLAEIGRADCSGKDLETALAVAQVVCCHPKHNNRKLGHALSSVLTGDSGADRFRQFLSSDFRMAAKQMLRFAFRAKSEGKPLNLYEMADLFVLWDKRSSITERYYKRENVCKDFYSIRSQQAARPAAGG